MHTFKRQTYSGQVVEFIKRCILDGELAPGEQVKEVMLAERLGISRAPIREALQILAQDGLITSEPQKGKFIRKMTRQEIEDEYEIGGILEGAGVAAALPAMTSVDVARLTGGVEPMARLAPKVGGLCEFSEVGEAFRNALLQHCANRRLVDMARSACANISKFLFNNHWNILFTPQEFVDRHRDILNSVLTGDPVEVEATLRAHYRESGRRMGQFGA